MCNGIVNILSRTNDLKAKGLKLWLGPRPFAAAIPGGYINY